MDTIKQIINKFNLITKKALGQNFILDENITDKIVRLSNIKNKIIVEIGPGPGCLTRSLVKAGAKKIIALEKDSKCIDIIKRGDVKTEKGNKKKIKSIFKILKEWWPTLLSAYILFGTGFTRMAVGLVKTVIWGVGGL